MKKELEDESTSGSNSKWYEEFSKREEPCKHSKSETEISYLKDEAKRYLDAEVAVYQLKESKSRNSEASWLKTALTQGTTSDKVAAAIVLVQDNPKHNLSRLTMIINQVRIAKHNQCVMVIQSLRDLFLCGLLHPKFKLLKFEEQNLNEVDKSNSTETIVKTDASRKKLMAHWYFEDQLREQYERFVMSLATIASDTVDANREAAISVMTDLLIGNSEQEHKLLELIVNKIGDPSNKVGSKVIFCLNKLLHEHPHMKLVVLREVEKLLFRKNVAQRAQYYAICSLTQFILDKDDTQIATTLIEVYFAFFKACLKKGEPDSRMMAAILTGVNRAYPFAKIDSNILHKHTNSVYKVVHIGSFNVSLNALNLLYQVTGKDETQSNRFYSTFYGKLLDPQIGLANKRALFLNLLFRVLQKDAKILRLYAFIRRTLQVALYFPANMTCAILYVMSKIIQTHKELKNLLLKSQTCVKNEIKGAETKDASLNSEDIDESEIPNINSEGSLLLTNVVIGLDRNEETKSELKEEGDVKVELGKEKEYDSFYRNPLYAGVTKGLTPELIALSKHYHPSVALFASTILEGKPIDYTGDPLEDLSLMRFLDRYVFKNPKKFEDKKVQKKNDPLAQRAGYTPKGIRCIPVDSISYLNESEARIPVDELFLYRYLKRRKEFKHGSRTNDDNDDIESINSEEFDDMLGRLTDGKDFEDLDIAADIQTRKKKKKGVEDDDDDDGVKSDASDDFDDMNDSEPDLDEDTDDELQDLSDVDLNEDDDIRIDNNIFVSAEKFAEMLEEHGKQKSKYGGTDMFNTADGASSKQIDWETNRYHKLKGSFNKKKRKGPQSFKKNVKKMKH
ncbi:CCAAT/enhancer-binding protein zeta [Dufourea novaeangliae]|uniref:CCAAT/enhancer-binding protein zeta n=1 Tax=Dufourea novaeangliae TaxID=178035 RepID=A0A154PRW3_DUFNO|nr:CCAAT/enhancer-binding protein zeta [Dufourea novaeangliae]